jgi:ATP:ADP antiporter, AAA family
VTRTRQDALLAFWSALTFGSLLTSIMTTRPVRDALVLEGSPDRIPWLFTASFVIFILIAPVWGAAVRKSPRRVVPASFHVFAIGSLVFALLVKFEVGSGVTPYAFYIWAAVYNQFVVSVFWSLLADLVGPDTARTLYGPIAAGGTIGAFCGPLLTKYLLAHIGFSGVMMLPSLFLELAVIGSWQIKRMARGTTTTMREDAPLPDTNPLNGLIQTAKSRYLGSLAAFTLLTAIAATFVYYAQANIVKVALPDRAARTDYFVTLDLWQQGATFVVQLVVAPFLLRRIGPGPLLCVLPLLQLAGLIGFWLAPSVALIAALHISGRTVALGLTRPARELCFTVVGRDDKYRAKNVIDTLMYRFGDFVSAWIFLALGLGAGLISLTVPLAIVWVAIAIWLGIDFRRRTA